MCSEHSCITTSGYELGGPQTNPGEKICFRYNNVAVLNQNDKVSFQSVFVLELTSSCHAPKTTSSQPREKKLFLERQQLVNV